jgi:hypothetical protein
MKRREFITLLGTAIWPFAARAQQPERLRRIGVLMDRAADNSEGQDRVAAFHQGLQEFGWNVGRNVRNDTRWSADNADQSAKYAAELIALARTSSWPAAPWLSQHCNVSTALCRSCSRRSLIRSAPVSSIAGPIRAAMPLAS